MAMPDNVRLFLISNLQHFALATDRSALTRTCMFPTNPLHAGPPARALLVALDAWITDGTLPPPSRYPSRNDATLVPPTAEAVGFPQIPGVHYSGQTTQRPSSISTRCRRSKEQVIRYLFPRPTRTAAISPEYSCRRWTAPIATHTGWNFRKAGFAEGELCEN